ncbi:MAG TPA: right-handed parallel beta-helix repeat-containing protein, partial [Chthoniobacterales bacterium]|nr:right-handed parallel beta-helix repeat-containing protein [Chthoniobacterales bacterium]
GFSAGKGIELNSGSNGWTVTGNEMRGNGIGNPNLDGIDVENGSGGATITGNLAIANQGVGIDGYKSSGGNTISNNTAKDNGLATGAEEEEMGIRIYGANNTVTRNIVSGNSIAGIAVDSGVSQSLISQNSIFGNGRIGIDLHKSSDDFATGTAPYVTPNDTGDGDTGGNGLLNFPVLTQAGISGGNLVLQGFARPGAVIEFFLAAPAPGGFGEGKTYLLTVTEGSAADTDATTGSYTNPVNGLNQGADTTNRFTFTVPVPAGITAGSALTATATAAGATSEFSGNVVVTTVGVAVSGLAYEDANLNLQRDAPESGTALTLYVKLIDTATPAGPALAAATVDPGTGVYSFPTVTPGLYTLVLDNNNTLTDITPTLPPGWTATEAAVGLRTPVAVHGVPLPNQNFGLYHGLLISGRVFHDNGAGGGAANDGASNGGETGLAAVAVKLTDTTGATVHANAATNSAGEYALALPSTIAAGTQLKIVETNANSFLSTGATVGNTAGTYARAADTISFTVAANTAYTNVNFGDVAPNTLSTDGQQAGLPGTVIFYAHTFTAATTGSVAFSSANAQTPAFVGWTSTLYRDTNANGQFDAGEPAITAPINVAANEMVAVIVKISIPANAPFGVSDACTLTANFSYTGATPPLAAALTRQDITTVGNPTTAGLNLTKAVDKPSALPGQTITYTVTYTNTSSDLLRNVVIYDSTPAFTKFTSASNGPLPLDLTGVAVTAPAPGATGAMRWTFAGTLSPGGTGTVSFTVTLDQ